MMLYIIGYILVIIAGISEAVMDKLQFHYPKSIFSNFKKQQFWNPLISWSNKYKNGDEKLGHSFPGSTTIFVGFTDAWHLFKLINHTCLFIGLPLLAFQLNSFNQLIIVICIARILHGFTFDIFFDAILKKK